MRRGGRRRKEREKRTTLYPYLTPYIKKAPDSNVKSSTVKLLGENVKENLCDLVLDKDFLDNTKNTTCKRKNS